MLISVAGFKKVFAATDDFETLCNSKMVNLSPIENEAESEFVKNLIERRVNLPAEEGIGFRPNTNIRTDISARNLDEEFDAIKEKTPDIRLNDQLDALHSQLFGAVKTLSFETAESE